MMTPSTSQYTMPHTTKLFRVGFHEHIGDVITHKLLDSSCNKIIFTSAVHPADDFNPIKYLLTDLGEQGDPTNPNPLHLLNPIRIATSL